MALILGEVSLGAAQADTLRGTADTDMLSGAAGADALFGLGDADALVGGGGADLVRGQDGDDLLFVDRTDTLIDGGDGIDTAILAPATTPYDFDTTNLRGIEAIQDSTGADTTIILDARTLTTLDDDSFTVSLGDGIDEVRIVNFGSDTVSVTGDQVVFDGKVVLRFEGVESLMLTGGADGSTNVVSQSLSPGGASSTTLRTFSSGSGTATTTTSTSITSDEVPLATGPATPPSAAERAADLIYPSGVAPITDLTSVADTLFQILTDYVEEADARRQEDAVAEANSVGNLFDDSDLFGLLSRDILDRISEADLTATG